MTWTTSTRRHRLPPNWATLRRHILHRDQHTCQIAGPGCTRHATDVDHIQPGDNHHPDNLHATCRSCHQTKTLTETPRPQPRTRPAEPHPGCKGGG